MSPTRTGVPLAVLDLPDTTCLGAALLGGIAAGLFADLSEARAGLEVPVRLVEPLPDWEPSARQEPDGPTSPRNRKRQIPHEEEKKDRPIEARERPQI